MSDYDRQQVLLKVLPLLLIPSGCAALIYQVAWVRLLVLSMGGTSASVSTVLTAFFLGMGIGSYFSTKIASSKYSGLMVFGILEAVIGLFGLLSLPIFLHLDEGMALLGNAGALIGVKFLISLLVLIIPTACMGATLPLISAFLVEKKLSLDMHLGKLYALNTLGAVFGALSSGFVLVPTQGLDGAVYVAFGLNIVVAILAYYAYLRLKYSPTLTAQGGADLQPSTESAMQFGTPLNAQFSATSIADQGMQRYRIPLVLFSTGFLAISSEVGWTKYLSIYIGATIYGFSAILAIFLAGIALGSWVVKKRIRTFLHSDRAIFWVVISLAVSLLLAKIGLAQLPVLLKNVQALGGLKPFGKYLSVVVLVFPATFLFGALFPVMLSRYCAQQLNSAQCVGYGYAINTVGSILGATVAGFWLIPYFGTNVLLNVTIALTFLLAWFFVNKNTKQLGLALASTLILAASTFYLPQVDYKNLITSNPYRFDSRGMRGEIPEFLFLQEGKAGVISLITYDKQKALLQNNGIQESYLALVDNISPPLTELLLGLMPYFLHPEPGNAFVIGFGGGHTVRASLTTPIEKLTVVELEPAVINAVKAVGGGEVFQNPHLQLKINDARNTLLLDPQKYDVMISQPSHPWLSGAGNLFTDEFFRIVASRLNSDGIFTQWVNLFNMDATTLRAIIQAFYTNFPHGFLFQNESAGDLIMFGSNQPLQLDVARIQQRMQIPAIKRALSDAEIYEAAHLLWYFSLSREEALFAAADIEPNSDTRILSEVRLAGMNTDPLGEENPYHFLNKHTHFDVLSYLKPDEAANALFAVGQYFYTYGFTLRTRQTIDQLMTINPVMAKDLESKWQAWQASKAQKKSVNN
jgi:spermidine synthase